MKVSSSINSEIVSAAASLLNPHVPELTPRRLIAALEAYQNAEQVENDIKLLKPYTIKEVMALLGISKPLVYRLFQRGQLEKITLGPGCVRISFESVAKLLKP